MTPQGTLAKATGSPLARATGRLVLRGTIASWAQYATALVITVGLTPFVLDRVGPAAYGIWLLLTQALGYSGLLDLGIHPALIRYVSAARAMQDRQELRQTLGTALRVYAAAAAACLFFGLVLAAGMERWFDLGGLSLESVRRTVVIAALAAAIGLPATALTGALKGFQRFDLAAALGLVSHLVRAAATVVALQCEMGLPGLAAAALLGSLVALIGGAVLLRKVSGFGLQALAAGSPIVLRRLLSFGVFSVAGTAGWQLAYGSDTILIGATLSATDAAHFGVGVNVLVMVSALVGAFTGNLMPLASIYEASGQTEHAQRSYLLGTRIALTLTLPVLVILWIDGPALLSAWLGSGVGEPAGAILRLLVIAYLPSFSNAAGIPVALGAGLHRAGAALALFEGVLKILLSLLWVGKLGTSGVAMATLAASVVPQGLLWPWVICRHLGLPLRTFWWRTLGPTIPATAALAAVLLLLGRCAPGLPLTARLFVAATVVIAYWIVTLGPLRVNATRPTENPVSRD